jgi:hypothetical protein
MSRNRLGFVDPITVFNAGKDIFNLIGGLFGSNHDDEIVNQLSQIQGQYGFNLTHDQIIHLLPADWGNPDNWNRTATVFIKQLQQLASWLSAGNSASAYTGWGGNFQPGAVSYNAAVPTFTPPPAPSGGSSGGPGGSQPKQAGLFDNPLILLGLVGIAFVMFSGKSKRRR